MLATNAAERRDLNIVLEEYSWRIVVAAGTPRAKHCRVSRHVLPTLHATPYGHVESESAMASIAASTDELPAKSSANVRLIRAFVSYSALESDRTRRWSDSGRFQAMRMTSIGAIADINARASSWARHRHVTPSTLPPIIARACAL